MPNYKDHINGSIKINLFQTVEFQERIHKSMDSTSHIHPEDRHRLDPVHTLEGVEERFGSRGFLTAISHLGDDELGKIRRSNLLR